MLSLFFLRLLVAFAGRGWWKGALGVVLGLVSARGEAGESTPVERATWLPGKGRTLAEAWENLGRVHRDPGHPWVQEVWLLGRYHGQYHASEGSAGSDDGWEDRRYRMGAQARFLDKLTLHAQMVSGSDFEPFYNGFTELWAQWAFTEAVALTLGQQKHRFTHERNASSRYINTIERSLLVNLFNAEYTPAVTLSGRRGRLRYYAGPFSNGTGRDMGEAFTEFDAGASLLGSVTYDLGGDLGTDQAHLNVCYLHSEANERSNYLDHFRDGLSAALILTEGPVSLQTEAVAGFGSDAGDAWALSFQPGVFLTEKIQLAGRYQVAGSGGAEGLMAQRRYERPAGLTTGDFYQAAYVGLNYHLAAHRLKLMTGVEYSTLGGEHLWTFFTAIRLFWGPHSPGPFPMAQMLTPR